MRDTFSSSGQRLSRVVTGFVDYLYPTHCAICEGEISYLEPQTDKGLYGLASTELCMRCNDFPRGNPAEIGEGGGTSSLAGGHVRANCRICDEPAVNTDLCLICQVAPPVPSRTWSALPYCGTLKDLIRIYKYGMRRSLGKVLGKIFVHIFREEVSLTISRESTIIVPIPSSHESVCERGFPHTLPLAQELTYVLKCPLKHFALQSTRPRSLQVSLFTCERYSNMEDAFEARRRFVAGKQVILVDDVLTTGATSNAAAEALFGAGARSVFALSLARSPQFTEHRLQRLSETWAKSRTSIKGQHS